MVAGGVEHADGAAEERDAGVRRRLLAHARRQAPQAPHRDAAARGRGEGGGGERISRPGGADPAFAPAFVPAFGPAFCPAFDPALARHLARHLARYLTRHLTRHLARQRTARSLRGSVHARQPAGGEGPATRTPAGHGASPDAPAEAKLTDELRRGEGRRAR